MRWRAVAALVLAGALLVPAGAQGAKIHFTGKIANDPAGSVNFDVYGKRTKKRFIPRKVVNLALTATYECFKPQGSTGQTVRSDLFSQMGSMKVSIKGFFQGQHVPPATSDVHSFIRGEFAKGTFKGTASAGEGVPQNGCSTFEPLNWTAKPTSRLH